MSLYFILPLLCQCQSLPYMEMRVEPVVMEEKIDDKDIFVKDDVPESGEALYIHFFVNQKLIEDKIRIDAPADIEIEIPDVYERETKVFLDGKEKDVFWKNGKALIHVEADDAIVKVVSQDKQGNQIEKSLQVIRKKDIDIHLSVNDDAYTLDDTVLVTFDEPLDSSYALVLEKSDQKQVLDCSGQNQMRVPLESAGKYILYVQNKKFRDEKSQSHSFSFTDVAPNLHFVQNGSTIHVFTDGQAITNKQLWLDGQEIAWENTIPLSVDQGQAKQFHVEGMIEDSFGQKSQSQITVQIDKKPPEIYLEINNNSIQNTFTLNDFYQAQITTDESCVLTNTYFMNGKPLQAFSLQDALSSLKSGDILQINVYAKDSFDNQSVKSFIIKKNQLLQKEKLHTEDFKQKNFDESKKATNPVTVKMYTDDYHGLDYRTWQFDENNQLQLEEKKLGIKANSKPKIRVMILKGKKKRVRILLEKDKQNSYFTMIRIENKKIPISTLKKDKLGNKYYEFVLKKKKVHLEIKAKNNIGNISVIDRTLFNKNQHLHLHTYRYLLNQLLWKIKHG